MMNRSFEGLELELRDDGRTVEGRIVPYGVVADVAEREADGSITRYKEQFLKRSCLNMAQGVKKRGNAAFVSYLLEHEEGRMDAKIGYATDLRDEEDGAYATFRLYDGTDLPKVQSMLRESHNGMSVCFVDVRPPRLIDGIVSRVQVSIDHVAATPTPVYETATIMAMRETLTEGITHGTPHLDELREWLDSIRTAPV